MFLFVFNFFYLLFSSLFRIFCSHVMFLDKPKPTRAWIDKGYNLTFNFIFCQFL